jgi:hypothetical protein
VTLEVFVEGVETGVGEEMTEGVVVAVAGSEVRAVEAAKLEDRGAGTGLVGSVGLIGRIAGGNFSFVFAEEGVGGVRHNWLLSAGWEERCRMGARVCLSCCEGWPLEFAGILRDLWRAAVAGGFSMRLWRHCVCENA